MAMGRRKGERQASLFIMTDDLPKSGGHPFYQRLNGLLKEAEFDTWAEELCRPFYEEVERRGRPSLPPGVYFRMLLIGYFEGIDSERGIAWRCADSLSLRAFLGIALTERTADHSTLSDTRKRLPTDVFVRVFQFVLQLAGAKQLLSGKTVAVDYAFRKSGDGEWKAYDVIIEGISYITNYRNQVAAEIKATSLDALIERLETQGAKALESMEKKQQGGA